MSTLLVKLVPTTAGAGLGKHALMPTYRVTWLLLVGAFVSMMNKFSLQLNSFILDVNDNNNKLLFRIDIV